MDSILTTIKKMLGLEEEYEVFDLDIITNINMVFAYLNQLGVGPKEGFEIEDASTTWQDYLGNSKKLGFVKTYMYLKVKQAFDPASSASFNTIVESQLDELEWRITVQMDEINEEN